VSLNLITDPRNLQLNSGGSIFGLVESPKSKAEEGGLFEESLAIESLFIAFIPINGFNNESYPYGSFYVPELLYALLTGDDSCLTLDIWEKWALYISNIASPYLIEYCLENWVIDKNLESSPLYWELSYAYANNIDNDVSNGLFFWFELV